MKKNTVLIIFAMLTNSVQPVLGQTSTTNKKVTIQGYLKDKDTGEALLGGTITHVESVSGTVSNYYGFYSITLPAESLTLRYSFVGYQSVVHELDLKSDTTINIDLGIETLKEVVISGDKIVPIQETTEMGTFTVSSKQIKNRPAMGGEVDVIKVLQLLPGVQSGNEGSAGLYVRGGGPDQNLILLDGVPIYNANHLFGFMSVFNTDAINNVKLIKGAFPARYGGRLSSVVDISMKEGNNKEFHGEGAVGLISAKLMLEGPIKSEKTSFAISGRRTYADALAQPFIKKSSKVDFNGTYTEEDPSGGYYFYDLTGKINHRFSDRDRLYLSMYHGKDKASAGLVSNSHNKEDEYQRDYDASGGLNWGSTIGILRWNHVLSPKLFSNTSLSYSRYSFQSNSQAFENVIEEQDTTISYQQIDTESGIRDWAAKIDLDYYPNTDHAIKFGVGVISHRFSPNVYATTGTALNDSTYNSSQISSTEYYAYLEDDLKLTRSLSANIGIHAAGFNVEGKTYSSIQPRLSLRYLINSKNSIKASYSEMTQFLHLLVNPGVGVPTDFWVPVTGIIPPQQGTQYALGWFHSNNQSDFEWSVEAYYKEMSNLIEYKEGAGFLDLDVGWQDKVEIGNGLSYGLEVYLKKSFGRKTDGWVGYTLSRTERTFENLNFGRTFPFKYDRTHDIGAAINHQLSDKVFLSANWIFGTGTTLTLPQSQYAIDAEDFNTLAYEYTERNGYRMRSYHRLDLSIQFNKKKKWGERDWVISIYNAYSRRNPFYIKQQVRRDNSGGKSKFREYTLFPIIPSISYSFKF